MRAASARRAISAVLREAIIFYTYVLNNNVAFGRNYARFPGFLAMGPGC